MTMNPRVFREYDIRGVAERDLGDAFVLDLGRSLGSHLVAGGARRIAVGRDCRLSSPRIFAALCRGLRSTGLSIVDVGVVPTPVLYFSVLHRQLDGGVQITGSHNPSEDNGFKSLRGQATIFGEEIQQLRRRIEAREFLEAPAGAVTTVEPFDIVPAYHAYVRDQLRLGPRRFKVVVDGGNGVGGVVLVPLLRALGFEVVELFCEPDGRFPNHHPDPTQPENLVDLQAAVAREGAELGLALDGDADRLGVVDARGRIVWGDQLMILFARAILADVPGATFVSEVKCSSALYEEIERLGGRAIMWKVGHSLIKKKMKEEGAQLAGEMSGHLFFAHRYLGYDDAVYAACRLLEILSADVTAHGGALLRTLADHVDTLPETYSTPELRMDCSDDLKFGLMKRAVEFFRAQSQGSPSRETTGVGAEIVDVIDIDGARVRWPDGWALVRASNTQPALVLRFEATSAARRDRLRSYVEETLRRLAQ
jgi:phosphomannomutase/phosphoglucomutase